MSESLNQSIEKVGTPDDCFAAKMTDMMKVEMARASKRGVKLAIGDVAEHDKMKIKIKG